MSIKYPVARNHPTLHAAPIFRPIKRGTRRRGLLRTYKKEQGTLEVSMFYELDVGDQDLMFAIFAIAREAARGKIIEIDNIKKYSDQEQKLLKNLELDLQGTEDVPVHDMPALKFFCTRYELLIEVGKTTTGNNYKWLESSLNRLSKIGFFYQGKKWSGSFNLLGWSKDRESDEIKIIINPISSVSICEDKYGYINVHREERHSLKTQDEKALHSRLCGLVSPGIKRTLYVDNLSEGVFADYDDIISDVEVRKRRAKIKNSAISIGRLEGWDIKVFGKGKRTTITVFRKSFKT